MPIIEPMSIPLTSLLLNAGIASQENGKVWSYIKSDMLPWR